MPIQDCNGPNSHSVVTTELSSIACPPATLTPPPQDVGLTVPVQPTNPDVELIHDNHNLMYVNNNTGAAMATSQEESMYISPDASPSPTFHGMMSLTTDDRDKMDVSQEETSPSKAGSIMDTSNHSHSSTSILPLSPRSLSPSSIIDEADEHQVVESKKTDGHVETPGQWDANVIEKRAVEEHSSPQVERPNTRTRMPYQGAKVDQELDWSSITPSFDFTTRPLAPRYPSSLFQCNSRYAGTQQSDRQIYNVYVQILTIDMDQCSCTGYLTIKGLTPEHETLQTYFTGEIIGGPGQKHGFRTKTAQWGASDKTDLTHWARFPAWKSYAAHTKKNLDFPYPPNGNSWWQQEHIFMRWKEHFLVPDHKTKSIAGASFEGFYYICLNQIEGRISGIYFHSKSEKYQQLELKHEGPAGIWHRGVTPCIEFR